MSMTIFTYNFSYNVIIIFNIMDLKSLLYTFSIPVPLHLSQVLYNIKFLPVPLQTGHIIVLFHSYSCEIFKKD